MSDQQLLDVLRDHQDRIDALERAVVLMRDAWAAAIESNAKLIDAHERQLARLTEVSQQLADDDPNAFLRDSLKQDPDQ